MKVRREGGSWREVGGREGGREGGRWEAGREGGGRTGASILFIDLLHLSGG